MAQIDAPPIVNNGFLPLFLMCHVKTQYSCFVLEYSMLFSVTRGASIRLLVWNLLRFWIGH